MRSLSARVPLPDSLPLAGCVTAALHAYVYLHWFQAYELVKLEELAREELIYREEAYSEEVAMQEKESRRWYQSLEQGMEDDALRKWLQSQYELLQQRPFSLSPELTRMAQVRAWYWTGTGSLRVDARFWRVADD